MRLGALSAQMIRFSASILRRASSLAIFFLRLSQGSGQSLFFDTYAAEPAAGAGDGLLLEDVTDGHGHHYRQKYPEGDQKICMLPPLIF